MEYLHTTIERLKLAVSSTVSRRTAFGVFGLCGISIISACSGSSSESANVGASSAVGNNKSQSPTEATEYKGKLIFNSYEGNPRDYKPGTTERKATGVPLPKAPEGMNEKTRDGLYKFIGYWFALWNYTELTGDTAPIIQTADDAEALSKNFQAIKSVYEDNKGWVISPTSTPIEVSLKYDKPYEGPDPDSYVWVCSISFNNAAKVYSVAKPKESVPLKNLGSGTNHIYVKYINNEWKYATQSIEGRTVENFATI